jgi:peptidoglycan hydrolase CwlO-like protein
MKKYTMRLLLFCLFVFSIGLLVGCGGKNPPPPIANSEYSEALAAAEAAEAKAEALEKERIALEKELEEKKAKRDQLKRDIEALEEELYYLKKGSGR